MTQLKDKLETAMKHLPELDKLKNQVEMTVTGEGLRIEMMESETGTFFESGSAQPTGQGSEMLRLLATEAGKLSYSLMIEGHTDSRPFAAGANYSNWELSSDRANAARRIMETGGLRPDQVAEVRGFADQRLRKADNPTDASNRRISVIVKSPEAPEGMEVSAAPKAAARHE